MGNSTWLTSICVRSSSLKIVNLPFSAKLRVLPMSEMLKLRASSIIFSSTRQTHGNSSKTICIGSAHYRTQRVELVRRIVCLSGCIDAVHHQLTNYRLSIIPRRQLTGHAAYLFVSPLYLTVHQ